MDLAHHDDLLLSSMTQEESQKKQSQQEGETELHTHKKTHKKVQSSHYSNNSCLADMRNLEMLYGDKVKFLEGYNKQLISQMGFLKQQNCLLEMEYQQKLVAFQKRHEDIVNLVRQKYHLLIQQLKTKLKQKCKQIEKLVKMVRYHDSATFFQSPGGGDDYQSYLGQAPALHKHPTLEDNFSQQTKLPSSQTPRTDGMSEIKMISLYQTEIDRLKRETSGYESRFVLEKQNILGEIERLRDQKEVLEIAMGRHTHRSSQTHMQQTMQYRSHSHKWQ